MELSEINKKNHSEIILDTPNRDEILNSGPPRNSKSNILGRGSYGIVFKAIYAGKQVAVKIIKNVKNDIICNEANILRWRHQNIVQLFKIEANLNYGIVIMERFPGQCLQFVLNSMEIPLEHRIHVALDIVNALVFCHNRRILHLDVKPQNVLVAVSTQSTKRRKNNSYHNRNYICKICDFGSSIALPEENQENTRKRVQGTVRYMSPEVIREDPLSSAADVYSLGVTMWQLKSRQLPYSWIECNETVAYQVVKTNLRPNHITSMLDNKNVTITSSPHKNCLCDQFSSEVSYKTLDQIHSTLNKIKTSSPFATKDRNNSLKRKAPEKLKNQISRNLISKFQNSFSGLKDNLFDDETTCSIMENEFDCEFPLKSLFESTKGNLDSPKAEELYDEIFQLCWSSDVTKRPSTIRLRQKLENLLIQTN